MFVNSVRDYSDRKITCLFQLADVEFAAAVLEKIAYVHHLEEIEEGLSMSICVQQIPEVIRVLEWHNIAIYSVIQVK